MTGDLPAKAFSLPPEGLGMAVDQPQVMALLAEIGVHIVPKPNGGPST